MSTPTPEVRPKSRIRRVLAWFGRGLAKLVGHVAVALITVAVAIVVAPWTPWFDHALSRWHYVEPTCGDPQGLKILDITAMAAKGDATVEVSSEAEPEKSWGMMLTFDGRPDSGWVPATRDDNAAAPAEASTDQMTLKFKSPQPIALVCVVNGKASDWVSYTRADRARTVELRLGDGKQEVTRRTSLRTLPEFELQNRQDLEMPDPAAWWSTKATYNQVSLTLLDRYLGSQVDDRNTGASIDTPTGLVMLAEVEVWVDKS